MSKKVSHPKFNHNIKTFGEICFLQQGNQILVQEVKGNWVLGAGSDGELDFKLRKCRAGLPWSPPFKMWGNLQSRHKNEQCLK